MKKSFFAFLAVIILSACSSSSEKKEDCEAPIYLNDYLDNMRVNKDFPCVIDGCGQMTCEYDNNVEIECKDQNDK